MNEPGPVLPQPPRYLTQVSELLAGEQPALWDWFEADDQLARHQEAVRLDLLKSAEPLPRTSCPRLYRAADQAAAALQLNVPVTLYQSRQSGPANASISTTADAAHVVVQGALPERLDDDELTAIMGHELGHVLLWQWSDGRCLTALRMLSGLCDVPRPHAGTLETGRRFDLVMEIFCDRCGLVAQGRLEPVITSLIKVETEAPQANAEEYLRQAAELRRGGDDFLDRAGNLTHPECYIRASALQLWEHNPAGCDDEIESLIGGRSSLANLDLLNQQRVARWTRSLIDQILAPPWMRGDAAMNHARIYFPDYREPSSDTRAAWPAGMEQASRQWAQSYFVFVLLDFVGANREVMEPALAHTLGLAEQLGIAGEYQDVARRELRLRKKQLEQIRSDAQKLINEAQRSTPQPDSATDRTGRP